MKPTHKTFVFGLALGALGCWVAMRFVVPSEPPLNGPAPGQKVNQ